MLVAVLMALMVSCAPSAGNETHIVILATSDLHGNVWGYTYEDNAESSNNGMARLYTYIKQVREENPLVFLIDGGDDIQGTIMTDDIANKVPDSEHPVMAAMNFMSYDSMTLGNHEFNWGISTMKKILSQAKFPVLGANILDQDGNYITGVDLSEDDPRRAEIIGYINDGLLPTPLRKSYNLADYDELAAEAESNRP